MPLLLCLPIYCLETGSSIVACVFVAARMSVPISSLQTGCVTPLFIRLLHINGCTRYSINPAKAVLKRVKCCVLIQNGVAEYLDTYRGLTQGDSLACGLFNFAMEKSVERTGILVLACRKVPGSNPDELGFFQFT
jgi:hypothetical protein